MKPVCAKVICAMAERIRLAVLTQSISHFEAPLFRLCAAQRELDFKVFYTDEAARQRYDRSYGQQITWGTDLLAGFASARERDARTMAQAAQAWRADVVLMYGYSWPGAPRIILHNWWHGIAQTHRGTLSFEPDPRTRARSRLLRPLGRHLLSLFDSHHFGGDYSREALRRAGASRESMFFVPYSVDSPYFASKADSAEAHGAARAIRTRYGWSPADRVLLFIAQHSWFKGPDIAMEVFAEISKRDPSTRFLIAGSGAETASMKRYANTHIDPTRIAFTGFVPSAETVPYYLAADLVLCTSRYETWARMVNEAMMCRRPCVVNVHVAAAGGLVSDDKNGYVTESLAVEDFIAAIQRHFAKPQAEQSRMGDAARARAMQFAYEPNMTNVVAAARYAMAHSRRRRH